MADETVFSMVPVVSSQIAAVGYDKDSQKLRVEFLKNGSLYQYDDVPEEVFNNLVAAPSVGGYFGTAVKGVYSYERLS
jgi:hypothetical protein